MMEWGTFRPNGAPVTTSQCPITGILTTILSTTYKNTLQLCKTGFLPRLIIWLLASALFPLSVTATVLSFKLEVLGCTTEEPGRSAEKVEVAPYVPLAERVLLQLEAAEKKELDPWLRDDIRIAWITTLYASQGNSQPHIDATYRVLGLHPNKVWPAILRNRAALLGQSAGESSQKKLPQRTPAALNFQRVHSEALCATPAVSTAAPMTDSRDAAVTGAQILPAGTMTNLKKSTETNTTTKNHNHKKACASVRGKKAA